MIVAMQLFKEVWPKKLTPFMPKQLFSEMGYSGLAKHLEKMAIA